LNMLYLKFGAVIWKQAGERRWCHNETSTELGLIFNSGVLDSTLLCSLFHISLCCLRLSSIMNFVRQPLLRPAMQRPFCIRRVRIPSPLPKDARRSLATTKPSEPQGDSSKWWVSFFPNISSSDNFPTLIRSG
jgi:hypothetical protein